MLNTVVTIPLDKLGSWHWLDKEHPFQLLSWEYNSRNRLFGYRGMCGETDYHFTLISCTDKEIVLQLKNIVTPARPASQPDPALEQRAQKLIPLLDKMDMARLLVKYEDSNNSLAEQLRDANAKLAVGEAQLAQTERSLETSLVQNGNLTLQLRDANAKLDAAVRTLNTTLDLEKQQCFRAGDLTRKVAVLEQELAQAQATKHYQYRGAESGRLPQTSPAVLPFVRMNADNISLGSTGMHGSTVLTVAFLSYDKEGTLRSFNAKTSQDAQLVYYFNVVPRTGEIKYVGYGVKA